jgi:hypothetical protein
MPSLHHCWRLLTIFAVASYAGTALCAQNNPCASGRVHVQVEDASGNPVPGLTAGNFKASMGKSVLTILSTQSEHSPQNTLILLDTSLSMGKPFPLRSSLHFLTDLFQQTPPETQYGILGFNDRPYVIQQFTADRNVLTAKIQQFDNAKVWGGATALFDAVIESVNQFRHMSFPLKDSAIILITDGEEDASRANREDTLAILAASGIRLFGIGIKQPENENSPNSAQTRDRQLLDKFAQVSGGFSIWLGSTGPAKKFEGRRWEYKVEKDFSNMRDIAGEMIREMSSGYELEIALPAGMKKPAKFNLEFVGPPGNDKRKLTLLYPELIYPCPGGPTN